MQARSRGRKSQDVPADGPPPRGRAPAKSLPLTLLRLQRIAGNEAVAAVVQRYGPEGAIAVQRACALDAAAEVGGEATGSHEADMPGKEGAGPQERDPALLVREGLAFMAGGGGGAAAPAEAGAGGGAAPTGASRPQGAEAAGPGAAAAAVPPAATELGEAPGGPGLAPATPGPAPEAAEAANPPPTPDTGGGTATLEAPAARPMVRWGSRGEAVSELQSKLNSALTGRESLVTDGVFGPKTYAAVVAFQTANGLSRDGIVGPMTWGKLDEGGGGGGGETSATPTEQLQALLGASPMDKEAIYALLRGLPPDQRALISANPAVIGLIAGLQDPERFHIQMLLHHGPEEGWPLREKLRLAMKEDRGLAALSAIMDTASFAELAALVNDPVFMSEYGAYTAMLARRELLAKLVLKIKYFGNGASNAALTTARTEVDRLFTSLANVNISETLKSSVKVHVIPRNKNLTDLAPFKDLKGVKTHDGREWSTVRGIQRRVGTTTYIAMSEEALIGGNWTNPDTKEVKATGYPPGFIGAHEGAHGVHHTSLTEKQKIGVEKLYAARKKKHPVGPSVVADPNWLAPAGYSASTSSEYFAQSVCAWFSKPWGATYSAQFTKSWLSANDSGMFKLLTKVFSGS